MVEAKDGAPRSLLARFCARSTARIGFVLLFSLWGSAVLAPLLASDLPFFLEGVDERAYERARRTLGLAANELDLALATGGDVRAAERAVRLRLETLRVGLPEPEVAELARFEAELVRAVTDARSRSRAALDASAAALGERASALADELGLADRGGRAGGVVLAPVARFPLLRALAPLDAFLIGAWLGVATLPVWRRRARHGVVFALALALGLPLAATVFGGAPPDVGIKAGIADGTIRAERAWFPPIAYGFAETHFEESLLPPSWSDAWSAARASRAADVRPGEPAQGSLSRHLLGTDALGRDVAARLLHGGRLSLAVGFLATALVVALGVVAGAVAGIFGGRVDVLFQRVVEVVQSFPALLLVLAGVAFVPRASVHPVVAISLAIAFVRWTGVARLVRGECLRLRELEFATAARALGLSPLRIAFRHLLPAALPPVLVAAAFASSDAVLTESAISFLGLGNGPPTPSWGGLIAEERDAGVWWLQVFPGLFVFATVVAYNLVGEGLREALDPRAALRPSIQNGRNGRHQRESAGVALAPAAGALLPEEPT